VQCLRQQATNIISLSESPDMSSQRDKRNDMRQIGRGFIVCNQGALIGRKLAKVYMDQQKRTYVEVNGELEILTEQHGYLAVD
jgi:hypothetical protein